MDEVARLLGVCKGTVRRWIKDGLPAIADQRPALILGGDILEYLNSRAASKQKCQLHECYCFSCRKPRAPAFGIAEFFPLTPSSGNLRALCETCSTIMHKRVAVARLGALKAILDVTVIQEGERIGESINACLNDDSQQEVETHA